MDVIRRQLLFGSGGLPLGLVTSRFRFADIRYLFSADFRAGCRGVKGFYTRGLVALLISISAIIVVLVGPSVALLLIPVWYEAWPAGGATFWINQNLEPLTLDVSGEWEPVCSSASAIPNHASSPNSTVASCIWAGFPYLANAFKPRASNDYLGYPHISYIEGTFERTIDFNWHKSGAYYPESVYVYVTDDPTDMILRESASVSAYTSNLLIRSFSLHIAQETWCKALLYAQKTEPGKPKGTLRYRQRNETRGSVKGPVPMVRTHCFNALHFMGEDGPLFEKNTSNLVNVSGTEQVLPVSAEPHSFSSKWL